MTTKHKKVIDFYADQLLIGYKRKEQSIQMAAKENNLPAPKPHGFGEVSAQELAEKLIIWFADGCQKSP